MESTEVQKEADTAGRKAVLFGVGAMVLAATFGWLLAKMSGGGPETVPVVVAAEDIPALTDIKEKQLKVITWPAGAVPKDAFKTVAEVVAHRQISLGGLAAGEPLLAPRLSTPERGLGVAQLVEPNMRAFVIQVNEQAARAQIVHPRSNVDVIATLEDPRTRDTLSKVILQNVQVLAVGDSVEVAGVPAPSTGAATPAGNVDAHAETERHRVVTLLVNPSEVEVLAFASMHGKLDLALRSDVDTEIVSTPGVNSDRMLGSRSAAAAAAGGAAPSAYADPRPAAIPAHARPHGGRGGGGAFTIRH